MPASIVNLELLRVLDALLQEESVTGAARRARLTTPAMSRALGRVRDALGDPILVRAGRKMVPSRRALALRDRVRAVVAEADAILTPGGPVALGSVRRVIVVRAHDSVAGLLLPGLAEAAQREAPGLTFRFVPEGDENVELLRDGSVDLDVGVVDFDAPEIRRQLLFHDRFVAVVREGHPLASGKVTAKRLAAHPHVVVARHAKFSGPIDTALREAGFARQIAASVPSFYAAVFVAARSDLIAAAPSVVARQAVAAMPVVAFPMPFDLPRGAIAQAWHPRADADPVHRWVRKEVKRIARSLA